jgi:uncharacterized phage infection (PIP) family protein YhgE
MHSDILLTTPFSPVFEEGDESENVSVPTVEQASAPPAASTPSATPKVFTQEDLNRVDAEAKRKSQEQLKKALAEIDALKARSNLNEKEKADMEDRLTTIRNEALTKEQLAKKRLKELQDEKDSLIQRLESEKKEWENRFVASTITRSLVDAAAKHKAYSPEQIVYILKENTRLAEELTEDGKPTGQYVTKVKLQDTSPEGHPVMLEFSPEDAVARMRELDKYKNLFQAEGSGGLGLLSSPPSRKVDLASLASDPQAYREARKNGNLPL